jgi:hypothetical protein
LQYAVVYDLCSAYDCVIPARGKELVKTDLAIPPKVSIEGLEGWMGCY